MIGRRCEICGKAGCVDHHIVGATPPPSDPIGLDRTRALLAKLRADEAERAQRRQIDDLTARVGRIEDRGKPRPKPAEPPIPIVIRGAVVRPWASGHPASRGGRPRTR